MTQKLLTILGFSSFRVLGVFERLDSLCVIIIINILCYKRQRVIQRQPEIPDIDASRRYGRCYTRDLPRAAKPSCSVEQAFSLIHTFAKDPSAVLLSHQAIDGYCRALHPSIPVLGRLLGHIVVPGSQVEPQQQSGHQPKIPKPLPANQLTKVTSASAQSIEPP